MENISKIQEDFETWAIKAMLSIEKHDDEFLGYVSERTDQCWLSWKASREAICVELPKNKSPGTLDEVYDSTRKDGFNEAIFHCQWALKALGVSYK